MKCPKCAGEMLPGFLQGGNRMAFNKQVHKLSLHPKDGQDVLIVNNAVVGSSFHGFICKVCSLIVFDYSDPNAKDSQPLW